MHNGHSSNYAPLIKTTPSSSNNCQGAFLTHSWLGSHWWQRCPSADFPNSILPCAAGVPALGQPLRTTTCCGWGPPGLQRKRVRGTSLSRLCVEESRWMWMSDNGHAASTRRRAKQQGANPIQRTADGREGGIQTRCASEEEKWSEEVNGQCHSRNRTKDIYINSLLYNHDKQKNIHTKI